MKQIINRENILITILAVIVIVLVYQSVAMAMEQIYTKAWVICDPESFVYVRDWPAGRESGYLYAGDEFHYDGKMKSNYLHIPDASTEQGEGWVHWGYVVFDEPTVIREGIKGTIRANGRVHARKTVDGDHKAWLVNGREVIVYVISNEWCFTNKGYVKTEFIEMEGNYGK